jgi:hypothetical protein
MPSDSGEILKFGLTPGYFVLHVGIWFRYLDSRGTQGKNRTGLHSRSRGKIISWIRINNFQMVL